MDTQIIETFFFKRKDRNVNEHSKEYTSKKHGHVSTKGKTLIDTSFHSD